MKRPEEADKVKDPNYCIYHRLVSHPVEKCFILKDKIMHLHDEGKIEFEDDSAATNAVSVEIARTPSGMIRFGSFEPIPLRSQKNKKLQQGGGKACVQKPGDKDDEGWTLVTRRRNKRKTPPQAARMVEATKSVRRFQKESKCRQGQKAGRPSNIKGGRRSSRRPITLNDFMPDMLRSQDNVFVSCYNVEEDREQSDDEKAVVE